MLVQQMQNALIEYVRDKLSLDTIIKEIKSRNPHILHKFNPTKISETLRNFLAKF
jgi:hypothetical protein